MTRQPARASRAASRPSSSRAQITPLLALVALLLGIFAVLVTPREEEPQINVTMANVLIPFPGASVRDVEQMVATPGRAGAVADRRHRARDVGVAARAWRSSPCSSRWACRAPRRWCACTTRSTPTPTGCRAAWACCDPIIKPKGIDDVPIVTLTLFSTQPGHRRLRPGARGAQHRGRAQARARHARGRHPRRPGPRGAGRDRPGAHGRRRRHRGRPAPARCSRPTWACRWAS